MALDWKFIQNFSTSELNEDQDDAQNELLFDQLNQYNLNGSESIEQLRKLFECSKLVMRFKANQVDVAIEEIDYYENIISRENLNQENLKSSNLEQKNSFTVDKQIELERSNDLLRTQLKEKDIELNRLEQIKSNLEQTIKLNELQLANFNQEIEQLREELHLEKEQINEQLADNNLPFEQLREMNKKFYMLLEEMKDMETTNSQLGEKVMKLNEELDSATHQIQTATKEMQYMKNNLNNLQEMNDLLINEKEEHLSEIKKLRSLTDYDAMENDDNLDTNSKKIQDLLEKLRSKETELNQLRNDLETVDRKQNEKEKKYFLKEIAKRDNHIKLLRNQLNQAIDDIDAQTLVIKDLIEKNIENIHKSDHKEMERTDQNGRLMNSNQMIGKLEEELKLKDKEMTILHQRNTLYEKGIYGLSEAIEEINKLTKQVKAKDNEIDELIKELNSINLKLSNAQDELDYLKEIMNADDDLKEKLNQNSDVKNDKLKILKLQKEVIRLDAEKLKLYEEVLSYKLNFNLDAKKTSLIDCTISDLKDVSSIEKKDENSSELMQLQKLNTIQQLENENRELQLAMKEILIGLKESDSKSDMIIDCPSLERLCQFFESRSINSNLTNVIALKAELDILRGQNEELRMTNKRLRSDIFKIFENYSKHLLTDFVGKHRLENSKTENQNDEINENTDNQDLINQTLTEDEFCDSDLSEGEIVLNSIAVIASDRKKQNKEVQTDNHWMDEIDSIRKEIKFSNDDLKPENSKSIDKKLTDNSTQTDQLNDDRSFIENTIQTDLCLNDLRNVNYLKEIDQIETILKFYSIDDLKDLINEKQKINKESTDQPNQTIKRSDSFTKLKSDLIIKKDASSQTMNESTVDQQVISKCNQCRVVQNLLIEFQNKFDRIDSSIVEKEDLYLQRINILQDENNRLQNELQKIVQIKDDLLNQKEKQIIELNDKILNLKENLINLEQLKKDEDKKSSNDQQTNRKDDSIDNKINQMNLDKQSIDNQLAIINKNSIGSSNNQRGLFNILERMIKCLQTTIEQKDESIAQYQKSLIKAQEEHKQEIQKLMKNYKKVTEHSLKAIQSSSNMNQEQLETTLVKYSDQFNEFKSNHQKMLADQNRALELQTCKLRKLKIENERLKSQSNSIDQMNRLRFENEQLIRLNDKLKNAIKENRLFNESKPIEPDKLMQFNKMKDENDNLLKVLANKDKEIKELQINKWNLEKRIKELMQTNETEIKSKTEQMDKLMNEKVKLKNLIEKLEKEKSSLKKRQVTIVKENSSKIQQNKSVQTDRSVNFDLNNQENGSLIDKFKQHEQMIETLKQQLENYTSREQELIGLLDRKDFKKEEPINSSRSKKRELSFKSIKGKTFEINKKNSCDF